MYEQGFTNRPITKSDYPVINALMCTQYMFSRCNQVSSANRISVLYSVGYKIQVLQYILQLTLVAPSIHVLYKYSQQYC